MFPLIFIIIAICIIVTIVKQSSSSTGGAGKEVRKETAKQIGQKGEQTVKEVLISNSRSGSRLLNDVVLKDKKGESYQIDHIFINWNGIWIIETKNWSGNIYGTDEQNEWTQVLAYGNEKHRHYNPVKQNLTHVRKITPLLGSNVKIIPLTVFVDADIRGVTSKHTCHIRQLPFILYKNYGETLTEAEIETYYQKILRGKEKSNVTSEEHSQKVEEKNERIKKGYCPRCGGELIKKEGKYGSFYGCSGFPQCRFTLKIDK